MTTMTTKTTTTYCGNFCQLTATFGTNNVTMSSFWSLHHVLMSSCHHVISLEKIKWSFLFLFSILKIFRKKFYFSSRFVRFLNPFSFSSWFSRFLRKISLSLLDWWDSETQISFSSRFSRYLEKILFLFSIYEIFENNSLSLLNFQDF